MSSSLQAIRRLSASALDLLLTRAQFASVELAQARAQVMRWISLALIGAILALLAVMCGSAALVILLWESYGALTLLVLAVAYAMAAYAAIRRLQHELSDAAPLLSDTLAELALDRDAILGRGAGADASSPTPPHPGVSP